MGVLKHLRKDDTLCNLYKSFGGVVNLVDGSKNKDKVLVNISECKVLNIPIVAPSWDEDVVFSICFRLAVEDSQGQASCKPEGSVSVQHKGIRIILG